MNSDKPAGDMPAEAGNVTFEFSAAGHQGITATADGGAIIKPCTRAEIEFYEAAAAPEHHDFRALIPTYMGNLQQGDKTAGAGAGAGAGAAAAVAPEAQQAVASIIDQSTTTPAAATSAQQSASAATAVVESSGTPKQIETSVVAIPVEENQPTSAQSQETIKPIDTQEWAPSGGAKLSTGLAIVLENATAGFKRPNVLDLKLGSRLWDEDAPKAKRVKLDEVAAATTSGSLGFRVAGMKIWMGEGHVGRPEPHTTIRNGYKSYDKNYGRNLSMKDVSLAIATFLAGSAGTRVVARNKAVMQSHEAAILAEYLLRELECIETVLAAEESRMYSASILIVVEGDPDALRKAMHEEEELLERKASAAAAAKKAKQAAGAAGEGNPTHEGEDAANQDLFDEEDDDDDEDDTDEDEDGYPTKKSPKVMEVRLIDFAHAKFTPGMGPDENALRGVRNVIRLVKSVVK